MSQQTITLTLLNADREATVWSREFLDQNVIRLGRGPDNDIRLVHATVSRSHAKILFTDDSWIVENLGKYGTFVNGQQVSRGKLENGSVIHFAQSPETLVFEFPEAVPTDQDEVVYESRTGHEITDWLYAFRHGSDTAANWLWQVYYERIVELARERLGQTNKRVADEEDVAQDAFKSVFVGLSSGRYADVRNRYEFWGLLVVVTVRKAINQIKHDRRLKRGGGRIYDEAAIRELIPAASGIDQLLADQKTPEFLAMMYEQAERLFAAVDDEHQAKIVTWKLEGYTNEEIAQNLGCSAKTVGRKVQAIREMWLQDEDCLTCA